MEKKMIQIVIVIGILIGMLSCNSLKTTSKTNKRANTEIKEIGNIIINDYKNLDGFLLCQKSLNYNFAEIITDNKTLKQALDIDLIEKFQKYSPGNDILIRELITQKDLKFMINQTKERIDWKRGNINNKIVIKPCSKKKYKSDNLTIGISKPVFNKNKTLSMAFVSKGSITEYNISLRLYEKTDEGWKKVMDLNM